MVCQFKLKDLKNYVKREEHTLVMQFHNDNERLSGLGNRRRLDKEAVNTVKTIQKTVQKQAETAKDSAAHAEQEVSNIIKKVHVKTESVKKEMQDGGHDITQDIHKTAGKISKDLKNL